jgi:hypothetical protein
MSESNAEKQIRLGLEGMTADIGRALRAALPEGLGFALFVFNYGDPGSFQNLAYVSSATRETMIATVRDWLQHQGDPPIPMVLHCPSCSAQHVDAPEPETGWTNPPHRSHLCGVCGCVWRPSDLRTVGVEAISSSGKDDTPAHRYRAHGTAVALREFQDTYCTGLRRAAEIVRSDKPTSRAEVAFGKLSDRADELPPDLAGLFAELGEAWAEAWGDLANAIEAEADER